MRTRTLDRAGPEQIFLVASMPSSSGMRTSNGLAMAVLEYAQFLGTAHAHAGL